MQNRGPELAAVSIAFLTTSWLFVSLRIYIRAWMIKSFGIDDWLILMTLVLFTIYNAFILNGVSYGTGQHMTALKPPEITEALKSWWFSELFYVCTTCFLKLSIGAFLLRVTLTKYHKYIIYVICGLSAGYTIYSVFLVIFQCDPVYFWWTRTPPGHCISSKVISNSTYALSAVTAVSDLTFGILPVFIVHDLQMNRRMKISVGVLLAVANVGSIATLIRIKYISQLNASTDFLYASTSVAIWSSVEPGVGIAAASIATYRPLFRSFFTKVDSVLRSGSGRPITNHAGYRRTSGMYNDMRPDGTSPSSTTRITGGVKSEPPLPSEERRWRNFYRQERHEMHDAPWKVNKTMEVETFESREGVDAER